MVVNDGIRWTKLCSLCSLSEDAVSLGTLPGEVSTPQAYCGAVYMIQGYAEFLRCALSARCLRAAGQFFYVSIFRVRAMHTAASRPERWYCVRKDGSSSVPGVFYYLTRPTSAFITMGTHATLVALRHVGFCIGGCSPAFFNFCRL